MDNATVQDQAQQDTAQPEERKPNGVLSYLKSPWVLLCPFILIGGMWLVTHPEIITSNIDKPYALLAGPALVGSVLVGWLFVTFFKAIASWCQAAVKAFLGWRKQDGSTFWLVIVTFLIVSVLESGSFFNIILGPLSLYDSLGYAAALVNDLIAVECMRARLAAVRMRDAKGSRLYLLGVVACASLSAFANVYTSLLHFQEPAHSMVPWIMIKAAPWIGMAFPLLIVFLSFAADYTADQTSSRLDPDQYEAAEKKRIRLLEIQRDQLRHRVDIEHELDKLNAKLGHKKERRTFFLVRWLFPRDTNTETLKEQILEETKPQFETLAQQNEAMQKQLSLFVQNAQSAYQNLATLVEKQSLQIKDIDAQRDTDNNLFVEQIRLSQEEMMQALKSQIHDAMKSASSMQKATLQSSMATHESTPFEQKKATLEGIVKEQKVSASSQGNAENSLEDDERTQWVLQNYPIVAQWHATGVASVTIEQIKSGTGHTPQKVHRHHAKGAFKKTRRPDHYRVDSVIEWLKNEPLPKAESTSKESHDTDSIEVVKDVKTPASMEVNNDPDTGEYEAIMKGEFEELSA